MQLKRALAASVALATTAAVAGCSVGGSTEDRSDPKTVVVASHDSWAMSKKVLRQFTDETGYRVTIEPNGDAGQLTNKLVLTKGSPIADMTYGIDNTFASRAVAQGILDDYASRGEAPSARKFALAGGRGSRQLTPVDYGDVCVNVDDAWFRTHRLAPPTTFGDLTARRYRGLFVVPGATTSSPGLAFLLATISTYGDRWPSYWKRLMANDTRITSGWSDAYEVDFTAGGGGGDRPIVLSYASSPPFTIPKGKSRPTTSSLLDTCFRQVEYAGVLKGAKNPAGARALIDFMGGTAFQEALPDNMYVFPVDDHAVLPAAWSKYAKIASRPHQIPPAEIAKNRDTWLRRWGDITSR